MRGQPPRTERIIGSFILLLAVLLVGVFLLTGGLLAGVVNDVPTLKAVKRFIGLSEQPLFKAEHSPPPPPLYERRVAEAMLPDMPQGWKRDVSVAQVGVNDDPLMSVLAAHGAAVLYQGVYTQGERLVTIRLADARQPEKAFGIYQARRPGGAVSLPVGRQGWRTPSPAAGGFWAGRYYTEITAAGPIEPNLLDNIIRQAAAGQLVYGGPFRAERVLPQEQRIEDSPRPVRTEPLGRARFPELKGGELQPPANIERYAENLYEKIDGKEGMFRAFHVVDLRFGQYVDPRRQQAWDVYIYDLSEPANAMGVFMKERSSSAAELNVGRSGYRSGSSVYFWKGPYYVNVLGPGEGGAEALAVSQRIAAAIAESIADKGEPFWAEALLPAEGRVPNTFRYIATSALGCDFLERMFIADYRAGEKSYQMFLMKAGDPAQARALFGKFVATAKQYDKVLKQEPVAGGETMVSDSMGIFTAAFYSGEYLGGVCECEDVELAQARAALLRESLKNRAKG